MYSLKTTKLKASLYDDVPVLCFCWGWVLACHVWLSPQLYLELSLLFALLVSLLILVKRCVYSDQGELTITVNQAFFENSKGRYRLEFEGFNRWRLLASMTHEASNTQMPDNWRGYFNYRYLYYKLKQALLEPSHLSIYHTMLSAEEYAYLRSFSAYQCHMSKIKDKAS